MRGLRVLLFLIACGASYGQTTQGLISGRILEVNTRKPVANAIISFTAAQNGASGNTRSDRSGYYVLPLLSPDRYRIRVIAANFQAQELYEVELRVAARVDIQFRLRPLSDVWEQSQYHSLFLPDNESLVRFFGPDVDLSRSGSFQPANSQSVPLETSVSSVIGSVDIHELPLDGRDVYAALVLQPNVTADTGTARGLNLSLNGQRPSSSNYLLDGLENDDYLVTAPLVLVHPEAIQEYRISTSNFSAEYGHTNGFIANAVTRSGGSVWHGSGYFNLENTVLDANSFQHNSSRLARTPNRQQQPGFEGGGPLLRSRLFQFAAVDYQRNRSALDPVVIGIPTAGYITALPAGSMAKSLLRTYPAPVVQGPGDSLQVSFHPPVSINRYIGLDRLDYVSPDGTERLMARLAVSNASRPDFIWSPYKDFVSGLNQTNTSLALAAASTIRPELVNEARLGFSWEGLSWARAHPEIPTLLTSDAAQHLVLLPGSPASSSYSDRNRSLEFSDNLQWSSGRHVFKVGGGSLLRGIDTNLNFEGAGQFVFPDLAAFTSGRPSSYEIALNRGSLPNYDTPQFDRSYRYDQYFGFAQYSLKATGRLALNFGIRYEYSGAPVNVGAVKDALVSLGTGNSLAQKLMQAYVAYPPSGNENLYSTAHNWAPRVGFSYALNGSGSAVLRGAYGIFYDRPFDNLWQNLANNNVVIGNGSLQGRTLNYLAAPATLVRQIGFFAVLPDLPHLTLYQPGIPNGYTQTFFVGVERRFGGGFSLEANGNGALARRLITTDEVNRDFSLPSANGADLRLNANLPLISYRGSQGKSDYYALNVAARYRARSAVFQAAYTWSHTIDIQSDPLLGDIFNLSVAGFSPAASNNRTAAFATQFDSQGNRTNSDFDQRHNLVFYSVWELPVLSGSNWAAGLSKGWRISQAAAFRSGFPYSAYGVDLSPPAQGGVFVPDYAQLTGVTPVQINAPIGGGRQLLNPAAFRNPSGVLGNTGRNEFYGPGIFNVDVSLSRSLRLVRLGEAGRITVRADAYNFLNHTNLNNPVSTPLGFAGFGQASYGRAEQNASFPSVTPFVEIPRQIQMLVRIEF
jgi:hypothetical protein